jgi:hypothetical protein
VAEALETTLEEIVAAGRVLFGPGFAADGHGWRDALKTTYRRRAMETHPDRARAMGRSESELGREFRKVAEAYRVLSALRAGPLPLPSTRPRTGRPPAPAAARPPSWAAAARPPPPPRSRPRPAPTPRPPSWAASPTAAPPAAGRPSPEAPGEAPRAGAPVFRVRYSGHPEALPRRRLRFAEYLYYSGRVPWTAFVDAISWQRRQRPALGRIAVDWGFLAAEDVTEILERRRVACAQKIPFGEFAVRLGYLTSFQLLAVLGRQLRLQRRIGEFFVEKGFLEPEEIDRVRLRIARHNARFHEE